jgi:cytochrome bd-type quinol oxidase subunit 1
LGAFAFEARKTIRKASFLAIAIFNFWSISHHFSIFWIHEVNGWMEHASPAFRLQVLRSTLLAAE